MPQAFRIFNQNCSIFTPLLVIGLSNMVFVIGGSEKSDFQRPSTRLKCFRKVKLYWIPSIGEEVYLYSECEVSRGHNLGIKDPRKVFRLKKTPFLGGGLRCGHIPMVMKFVLYDGIHILFQISTCFLVSFTV